MLQSPKALFGKLFNPILSQHKFFLLKDFCLTEVMREYYYRFLYLSTKMYNKLFKLVKGGFAVWIVIGVGKKSLTFRDMNGTDAIISFLEKKEGIIEITYFGKTLKGQTNMMILQSFEDVLQIHKLNSHIIKTSEGKFLKLEFFFKGIECLLNFELLKIKQS